MLLLTCPSCGARDETEFSCGGESHIARPLIDSTDDEWANYLFYRDNPKAMVFERWRHSFGCGQWFNIARDPVSHRIAAVYAMSAPKPELAMTLVASKLGLTEDQR